MVEPITFEDDPEFNKLAELGFISEYVQIRGTNHRVVSPAITAQEALDMGFSPRGTLMRWEKNNGYPYQIEQAEKIFDPTQDYKVRTCQIGRSSSTYEFEGIVGRWNSVMFVKSPD